jgi:hypothetical protein
MQTKRIITEQITIPPVSAERELYLAQQERALKTRQAIAVLTHRLMAYTPSLQAG